MMFGLVLLFGLFSCDLLKEEDDVQLTIKETSRKGSKVYFTAENTGDKTIDEVKVTAIVKDDAGNIQEEAEISLGSIGKGKKIESDVSFNTFGSVGIGSYPVSFKYSYKK